MEKAESFRVIVNAKKSFRVIADAAAALGGKEVVAAKWGSITRVDTNVDNPRHCGVPTIGLKIHHI